MDHMQQPEYIPVFEMIFAREVDQTMRIENTDKKILMQTMA